VSRRPPAPIGFLGTLVAAALVLAGCSGPILANPPLEEGAPPASTAAPPAAADPLPIVLPRDDGPHDRMTEWWYYTGHLVAADGRRFGFEAVVFRAERGAAPTTWASHVAITDESGQRFLYAQRASIGPQVDASPRGADGLPTGFDLRMGGLPLANGAFPPDTTTWRLAGADGKDTVDVAMTTVEGALAGGQAALRLDLAASKPPTLHRGSGWIDFGRAGGSYYYSRTRMAATGTLTLDGIELAVTGDAWFDHQWGDFIAVGGGGWDWYAVNLADGTDVTLSLVREADGSYPLVYGTLVRPDGTTVDLGAGDFVVAATATWTSPVTGAVYPAAWTLTIPGEDLVIRLRPTVAGQELDTRATTGVVYWEGSQVVEARRGTVPVGGEAYVELTGYAVAGP
jgi:predicted secreted hydrolase